MNITVFEYFFIVLLLLFYIKKDNKLIVSLIFAYVVLKLILVMQFFSVDFFSLSIWKTIFIFLLTLSFFFILSLVKDKRSEIYFLICIVWLGSLLIIISSNLLVVYLGLELQTFSLFILIAKNRFSIKSSESGLKYFILGSISSGFFLLSLTSLYGIFGSVDLNVLLSNNYFDYKFVSLFTILTLSLFFKLSLFPLHFWVPDVYEGSSSEIVGLLSTIPKISLLGLVLQLNISLEMLLLSGVGSIIIGSLGALNQNKLKRLIGYSGISHMGFVVLGLAIFSKIGLEISILYLFIYVINILGLIILLCSYSSNKNKFISDLAGLGLNNIFLGIVWSLIFLSIAGIPPLSGFLSKWWVILTIISYEYLFTSLVVIIFSAVAVGFYLRISKIIYFQPKSSFMVWSNILQSNKISFNVYFLLGIIFYFNLFLIINSAPLNNLINFSLITVF
uniref:NADH:ubiquinone reductase (H(+)-translocating) n=1 Tax=Spirocodon saltatrix TaxID=6093 RepID=A0A7D5NI22_9CNID|nr:NADH dehydrogenase subunit 2 [Spirocodon saltatrix]QLH56857.1 NADH dehydrogenase subunit 2 [Spirocodon saltatrix]